MLKVLVMYVLILQMRLKYKLKTRLVQGAFLLLEEPDNWPRGWDWRLVRAQFGQGALDLLPSLNVTSPCAQKAE